MMLQTGLVLPRPPGIDGIRKKESPNIPSHQIGVVLTAANETFGSHPVFFYSSEWGDKVSNNIGTEKIFGFQREILASLLMPKRALCNEILELCVDSLRFVGRPTTLEPEQPNRNRRIPTVQDDASKHDTTIYNVSFVLNSSRDPVQFRGFANLINTTLRSEDTRSMFVRSEIRRIIEHAQTSGVQGLAKSDHGSGGQVSSVPFTSPDKDAMADMYPSMYGMSATAEGVESVSLTPAVSMPPSPSTISDSDSSRPSLGINCLHLDAILESSSLARFLRDLVLGLTSAGCVTLNLNGWRPLTFALPHGRICGMCCPCVRDGVGRDKGTDTGRGTGIGIGIDTGTGACTSTRGSSPCRSGQNFKQNSQSAESFLRPYHTLLLIPHKGTGTQRKAECMRENISDVSIHTDTVEPVEAPNLKPLVKLLSASDLSEHGQDVQRLTVSVSAVSIRGSGMGPGVGSDSRQAPPTSTPSSTSVTTVLTTSTGSTSALVTSSAQSGPSSSSGPPSSSTPPPPPSSSSSSSSSSAGAAAAGAGVGTGGTAPPGPPDDTATAMPLETKMHQIGAEALISTLPSDGHPLLTSFIAASSPLKSFADLQVELAFPFSTIYSMSCHIRNWGYGKVIPTVTKHNIYMVNDKWKSMRREPLAGIMKEFRSHFPSLNLFLILEQFSSARPLSEHLSRISGPTEQLQFIGAVMFLLAHDIITQVQRYFFDLRAKNSATARASSSRKAGRSTLALPAASTTLFSRSSSGGSLFSTNSGSQAGSDLLSRLCPYFNGLYSVEEIMWRENVSRAELETLFIQNRNILADVFLLMQSGQTHRTLS